MSDTYSKAISDAEKTILDVCAGRKCLPQCLERMRRTGSPGPCGCGAPVRRGLLWLWVLAVLAVLTAVFTVRSEVQCVWMGNGYSCSGSGDTIHVIGGLPGGEGGGSVVTNMIGTCTNCVAMSPQYVRYLKDSAISDLDECDSQNYVAGYEAQSIIGSASFYTNTYQLSGLTYSGSSSAMSPLIATVQEWASGLSESSKPVMVASSVSGATVSQVVASGTPSGLPRNFRQNFVAAYDAAVTAYNDAASFANSAVYHANEIYNASTNLQVRLDSLRSTVNQLSDEQCTAQWDGGSGLPGDGEGGGNVVTNQVSGDWCTFDQGEAIKELLGEIKRYNEKQISYLVSCSNYLQSIDVSIRDALFSSYSAIPNEQGLGSSWQTVYLSGQPTSWGYEPTNILARIELLLYGLTGVGTNHTSVVDTDEAENDGTDNMSDAVSDAVSEADFSRQEEQLTSIKDALLRFCDAFYVENPNLSNARFTPEIRFRLQTTSGEEFDTTFDSVTIPQSQVGTVEAIIETIRVACIVFYYVLMAYCVFAFWRTIAKYVVFAIKWAQELLTSIFAD